MKTETCVFQPFICVYLRSSAVPKSLPTIMREGLVGLGHAVHVLALLHRVAAFLGGVHQLIRQTRAHGLACPVARRLGEPAHGERGLAAGAYLDRHLIGGAADAPTLDLHQRAHVVQGLTEQVDRILLAAARENIERAVHDLFRRGLLAVAHDDVDKPRHQLAVVLRIRRHRTLRNLAFSWHTLLGLLYIRVTDARYDFWRFVPYLERPCLRSATPAVSSVPRTV